MYDKISALLMLILTGALSIIFIFSTVILGFFSLFTFVFIGILSGLWYKSILMFNKMNIQRKMDELTDKYGEVCHGLIMGISPELIADIYVYLPATNSVSLVKYEITHDFEKFEIGKHVKANFYNNDINILNVFENHTIPDDVYIRIINHANEQERLNLSQLEQNKF